MTEQRADQASSIMQRFFFLGTLCLVSCLADEEVKNATAAGSYGTYYDYSQPVNYAPPPPHPPPNYGPYAAYQYIRLPRPPLVDRDVCDLDASVLLVAQSKRHGRGDGYRHHHHLNRAYRVRCSAIANFDEDSCNVCCQNAARRDKNLPNHQFVGFLAVTEDFMGHPREDIDIHARDEDGPHGRESCEESDEDCGIDHKARIKRQADPETGIIDELVETDNANPMGVDSMAESVVAEELQGLKPLLQLAMGDFKPGPIYKNVKCVCCAPKRPLPPPPPIYHAPPVPPPQPVPAPAQPVYQAYKA